MKGEEERRKSKGKKKTEEENSHRHNTHHFKFNEAREKGEGQHEEIVTLNESMGEREGEILERGKEKKIERERERNLYLGIESSTSILFVSGNVIKIFFLLPSPILLLAQLPSACSLSFLVISYSGQLNHGRGHHCGHFERLLLVVTSTWNVLEHFPT